MRPATAKKGPPRKKVNDNFDKIKVEEKNLPTGIILDNEENDDEKNTSFDNNITKNIVNTDNIDKNQHGYLVREIMDQQKEQPIEKKEETQDNKTKIRMGRIGNKKKENTSSNVNNPSNHVEENIKVNTIEDIEALRKAVQNLCQYANPLGRLMEQFVEDIPNMEKEFDYWMKQADIWNGMIDQNEKENEQSLGKIQGKINGIEEQIKTQTNRINNIKSCI